MEDTVPSLMLDDFKMWSINALKVFLRLRKKKTDGSYDELLPRYLRYTFYNVKTAGGGASNESTIRNI